MGELFDRFNVEPMQGKDITIGDFFPEIFISETDEVYCYLGICLSDEDRRSGVGFMRPYYMVGKHSTDSAIVDEIAGFYRIIEGCIISDDYVDCKFRSKQLFKRINSGIRLPHPDSHYAVFVNREEDEELTRSVFGLTYKELTTLLDAYAKVMDTGNVFTTYPRLTRSITANNFCDLTECWIPKQFPYVTFNENGYDFSHLSLWGLYRYMQLITGCKINTLFSQALLKCGATEDILNKLFQIGNRIYLRRQVTRTVLIGSQY